MKWVQGLVDVSYKANTQMMSLQNIMVYPFFQWFHGLLLHSMTTQPSPISIKGQTDLGVRVEVIGTV